VLSDHTAVNDENVKLQMEEYEQSMKQKKVLEDWAKFYKEKGPLIP
jgi:hypothetical protein